MQANHRKYVEQLEHVDSFYLSLIQMISFKTHSNSEPGRVKLGVAYLRCVQTIWGSGDPPTLILLPIIYQGTKQKKKEPRKIRVVQPILFWKLILRLGFFDEVDHIVLFIIGFQEDFQTMTVYLKGLTFVILKSDCSM